MIGFIGNEHLSTTIAETNKTGTSFGFLFIFGRCWWVTHHSLEKRESNWKEICVLFLCEVVLVYFLSSGHFRCNGCSSDHVFVEKCVRDDVENVHQWDKPKEINDKKNNIECEYVEAIINNKLISGKKRRRENMCVCFQWRMGGRWDGRALAWTIFFFLPSNRVSLARPTAL